MFFLRALFARQSLPMAVKTTLYAPGSGTQATLLRGRRIIGVVKHPLRSLG